MSLYKAKYLKYKNKYLEMKKLINIENQSGGMKIFDALSNAVLTTSSMVSDTISSLLASKLTFRENENKLQKEYNDYMEELNTIVDYFNKAAKGFTGYRKSMSNNKIIRWCSPVWNNSKTTIQWFNCDYNTYGNVVPSDKRLQAHNDLDNWTNYTKIAPIERIHTAIYELTTLQKKDNHFGNDTAFGTQTRQKEVITNLLDKANTIKQEYVRTT